MDEQKFPTSLFVQDWWLDAVAPGAWSVATVEENGRIIARMPYVIRHRRGLTLLDMPLLTPHLGPWLAPLPGKYATRLAREHQLLDALIQQLPPFAYFSQRFHPRVTNWLPFYWRDFQQTTYYTYILPDLSDLDVVWEEFRPNIKRAIRKAQKQVQVRDDLGLETFWQLNQLTFQRQGLKPVYDLDFLRRIDAASAQRGQRRILFAQDAQARVHAALYLVWDEHAAYYLMGGNDPDLQNSGAPSLLMWAAIQFAATVSRRFDFEGSMLPGVERFFRSFGARQTPYFRVTKVNSLALRIRQELPTWLQLFRKGPKSKVD